MDLSTALTSAARVLIDRDLIALRTFIYKFRTHQNTANYTVVVSAKTASGAIAGTGTADSVSAAFIRSVCEWGEMALCLEHTLDTRNGLAGGILRHQAVLRAKRELVEQDAFLYHYRNLVPFGNEGPRAKLNGQTVQSFELQTADPSIHCAVAFAEGPREIALGSPNEGNCLLIGLGAESSAPLAQQKAQMEISGVILKHQLEPSWCGSLGERQVAKLAGPDLHHKASRDIRNHSRLGRMTAPDRSVSANFSRPFIDPALWVVTPLPSPIRGFKYIRVQHAQLIPMQFGIPENSDESDPHLDGPLFHPFW